MKILAFSTAEESPHPQIVINQPSHAVLSKEVIRFSTFVGPISPSTPAMNSVFAV